MLSSHTASSVDDAFQPRHRSRGSWLRTVIVTVAVIVGASMPSLIAYIAMPVRGQRTPNVINDFGADAAQRGWPAQTPTPWPAPTQWAEHRSFGYRYVAVYSGATPQATSHQMQFESVGWPVPVVQRVEMWWPEDGPQPSMPPNMDWVISWEELIVTSAFAGIACGALVAMPWIMLGWAIRGSRLRRNRCPACAYPLGDAPNCSECGEVIPRATAAAQVRLSK